MMQFILLLILCFIIGMVVKKATYQTFLKEEEKYAKFPLVSFGGKEVLDSSRKIKKIVLVSSSAVVGVSLINSLLLQIQNIFGGRMTAVMFATQLAKRKAILYLKKDAVGADVIVNLRIESIDVANNTESRELRVKDNLFQTSVIAYGTAITYL